jgi:hypothetical protein
MCQSNGLLVCELDSAGVRTGKISILYEAGNKSLGSKERWFA